MIKTSFLVTVILLLVSYNNLFSQDITSSQDITKRVMRISDVIVVSKKSVVEAAVTKTVVDSVEIAQSANSSLADLLTKSTPLFIKTYGQGSVATVSFRGTGASHTQVDWNGININNPMLGQVDFSQIPMWFVDNVELYHGGSSLHNSNGALGGAVSIGTKPRWGDSYHGRVVQSVASFGKYQTMLSSGVGNDKFQFKIRYLYERADNDFEFINSAIPPFDLTVQRNAGYQKHAVVSDLYYRIGVNNFLSLNTWFHTSDRNLPTIMSYEGLGRKESDKSDEARVVLKWSKFWQNIRTELLGGYSYTGMDYLLQNNTYIDWVTNTFSNSSTNSMFSKYNVVWDISDRTILKVNANLNYHDVSTLNRMTLEGYSHDRLESGFTISFHHRFNDYLSSYALMREELVDGEFSPVMPSIGLSLNPLGEDKLILSINGTRNYHNPTLNDLYWQPGGNPDLVQEEGYSGDVSLEYSNKWEDISFKVNSSAYLSLIDDWIIWQPGEFMYWSAHNIQKVFSRGVEFNFDLRYKLTDFNFILKGNYAFTRTTNESDDIETLDSFGKQLIYIPLNKANVLFSSMYKGYYLDFIWSFTDERFTTSSNEITRHKLPYYSVCDLTLGKKIAFGDDKKRDLDIQFKVNNIFNVDYQAILWRAMPSVNYQLQFKFDF